MNYSTEATAVAVSQQDLSNKRQRNQARYERTLDAIYRKYGRNFDHIADEIDIETGEIVVNRGHIERMRHEYDDGTDPDGAARHPPRASVWLDSDDVDDEGDDDDILAIEDYMRSDEFKRGITQPPSPGYGRAIQPAAPNNPAFLHLSSANMQSAQQSMSFAPQPQMLQNPAMNEMLQQFSVNIAQQIAGFISNMVQQSTTLAPQLVQNNVYIGDNQRHSLHVGQPSKSRASNRGSMQQSLHAKLFHQPSPIQRRDAGCRDSETLFRPDGHILPAELNYHQRDSTKRKRQLESPSSKRRRFGTPGEPSIWADLKRGRRAQVYADEVRLQKKKQVKAQQTLESRQLVVEKEIPSSPQERHAHVHGMDDDATDDPIVSEDDVVDAQTISEDGNVNDRFLSDDELTRDQTAEDADYNQESSVEESHCDSPSTPIKLSSSERAGKRMKWKEPSLELGNTTLSEGDSVIGDELDGEPEVSQAEADQESHDDGKDAESEHEADDEGDEVETEQEGNHPQKSPSKQDSRILKPMPQVIDRLRNHGELMPARAPTDQTRIMPAPAQQLPIYSPLSGSASVANCTISKLRDPKCWQKHAERRLSAAWSPEEDQKLLKLRRDMGSTWAHVSKEFPDRSISYLNKRYAKLMNELPPDPLRPVIIRRGRWAQAEIAELVQLVEKQRLDWPEIATIMRRSEQQVQVRYKALNRPELPPSATVRRDSEPQRVYSNAPRNMQQSDISSAHVVSTSDVEEAGHMSAGEGSFSALEKNHADTRVDWAAQATKVVALDDYTTEEDAVDLVTIHSTRSPIKLVQTIQHPPVPSQPRSTSAISLDEEAGMQDYAQRSYALRRLPRQSYVDIVDLPEEVDEPTLENYTENTGDQCLQARTTFPSRRFAQTIPPSDEEASDWDEEEVDEVTISNAIGRLGAPRISNDCIDPELQPQYSVARPVITHEDSDENGSQSRADGNHSMHHLARRRLDSKTQISQTLKSSDNLAPELLKSLSGPVDLQGTHIPIATLSNRSNTRRFAEPSRLEAAKASALVHSQSNTKNNETPAHNNSLRPDTDDLIPRPLKNDLVLHDMPASFSFSKHRRAPDRQIYDGLNTMRLVSVSAVQDEETAMSSKRKGRVMGETYQLKPISKVNQLPDGFCHVGKLTPSGITRHKRKGVVGKSSGRRSDVGATVESVNVTETPGSGYRNATASSPAIPGPRHGMESDVDF